MKEPFIPEVIAGKTLVFIYQKIGEKIQRQPIADYFGEIKKRGDSVELCQYSQRYDKVRKIKTVIVDNVVNFSFPADVDFSDLWAVDRAAKDVADFIINKVEEKHRLSGEFVGQIVDVSRKDGSGKFVYYLP